MADLNDDKICKLIYCFEKRSLLYDIGEKDYHNKIKKQKLAIEEIANELETTGIYHSRGFMGSYSRRQAKNTTLSFMEHVNQYATALYLYSVLALMEIGENGREKKSLVFSRATIV
jgi:hypothetical protein